MSGKYDDIINLPHHQSSTRPHMSLHDRAAQFSPFSALTGYDSVVQETARLTDRRMELDGDAVEKLNEALRQLQEQIAGHPKAAITYFVPDGRKQGGAYVTVAGTVRRINEVERVIVLDDGAVIPIPEIAEISVLPSECD